MMLLGEALFDVLPTDLASSLCICSTALHFPVAQQTPHEYASAGISLCRLSALSLYAFPDTF